MPELLPTALNPASVFTHQHLQFSYCRFGRGPAVMLAFHGIGQDSACFAPFEARLGRKYTIYSIDLPFHGSSTLRTDRPVSHIDSITHTNWLGVMAAFLEQHGIGRFSVAGFSLGGRFALATAHAFADRLDQLILLAPDGITPNPWYRLATRTAVGRALFRQVLNHTPWLHKAGLLLAKLGLVDRSVLRFAEALLASPTQRDLIYHTWLSFRFLLLPMPPLADRLNRHEVWVRIFAGHFDKIMPLDAIQPLTRHLTAYDLTVLRTGHNRLIERVGEVI